MRPTWATVNLFRFLIENELEENEDTVLLTGFDLLSNLLDAMLGWLIKNLILIEALYVKSKINGRNIKGGDRKSNDALRGSTTVV